MHKKKNPTCCIFTFSNQHPHTYTFFRCEKRRRGKKMRFDAIKMEISIQEGGGDVLPTLFQYFVVFRERRIMWLFFLTNTSSDRNLVPPSPTDNLIFASRWETSIHRTQRAGKMLGFCFVFYSLSLRFEGRKKKQSPFWQNDDCTNVC